MSEPDHRTARILAVVQRIPPGHVATYGDVARLAGLPRRARLIGKVLRDAPEQCAVPWHRVINATGRISQRTDADSARRQQQLLSDEGIEFNQSGRIDLNRYRWPSAATTPM